MGALRFAIVTALVLTVGGGGAEAGDRELARQRYQTGTMLYQRGRYADALVELQRGNQAEPKPEFDYNIGLCLEKLGRTAEAADAYERFLAARPHDREAAVLRADIERLRRSVAAAPAAAASAVAAPVPSALPAPSVVAPPPSVIPPSEPAAPRQPYGAPSSVADAFAHDVRPPSFAHTTRGQATIALATIGGAALLTAAITGGVALSERDSYRAACAAGRCDDASYDGGRRVAVTTDVLLAVGAAAAVTATLAGVIGRRERALVFAPSAGTHAVGLAVAGGF
ncbi:MAG TPA: tetratricopeptide repeat protein [Polyangia bacterium]|nr:tetratricopeptide repeat protein [Polyangia bacterium]